MNQNNLKRIKQVIESISKLAGLDLSHLVRGIVNTNLIASSVQLHNQGQVLRIVRFPRALLKVIY